MNLQLLTPPAVTPVSLDEAKAHLNVDDADDDALITALINAATDHLDGVAGILGRALVTQIWVLKLGSWSDLVLPLSPVGSINEIRYVDGDGNQQTWASTDYALVKHRSRWEVCLQPGKSFPGLGDVLEPIEVEFVAGYGDAAAVPAALKAAIKLHVGTLYEHRETVITGTIIQEVPHAYDALIAPYRLVNI